MFFPVTDTEEDYKKKAEKLRPFLSDRALLAISVMQPWSEAQMNARKMERGNDDVFVRSLVAESRLRRLNQLSNVDKHRRLSLMLFRPNSVSDGVTDRSGRAREDPLDELADIEWLGIARPMARAVELPVELQARLREAARSSEPHYDFYFSGEELADGVEIGRYLRHDRSKAMEMRDIGASLRVVLFESGLTDVHAGAPPVERVLAELISAVDITLDLIDYESEEVAADLSTE